MAVNLQFDKIEWVEIGVSAADHVEIENVISFADRVVSPDGDMIDPLLTINAFHPAGVHHNHKYWEMELVLDSDWLPDNTAPTAYWAYTQQVQAGVGASRAIKCNDDNDSIEWFKVYVREADGTQTKLTYADEDTDVVWCIGETSQINNERGERHQPKTWRFICLQERSKAYTADTHTPGANEEAIKIMRCDNFTIGANSCTNVLSFEDEFVMNMTPQFIPNTFQGVDMKQDQHWRVLTVVVDSETSIFDPYIDITTANSFIPAGNFYVEFTLADGAGTTERWAYTPGDTNAYIINRREGEIHADVPRDTIEYQLWTLCTKTVTHP